MRKRITAIILSATLLFAFSGCASTEEEPRLTVVCTTYPIYLFASALTEKVEGVAVERLDTGNVSCLHDYTLSMADMKKIEKADVIAVNGAGLEDFLEDALATSNAVVIDCSEGVDLLENLTHDHDEDDHDHDGNDHGHWDPHYWMDPANARIMVNNLYDFLILDDPDHEAWYETNFKIMDQSLRELQEFLLTRSQEWLSDENEVPGLITFHDGFQYFAAACGLPLLASIEEEAGSEASAHEIVEISELVKQYDIPVIFTEANGSDATANAISRETGCSVQQLTMVMDGPEQKGVPPYITPYLDGLEQNIHIITIGFWERKMVLD